MLSTNTPAHTGRDCVCVLTERSRKTHAETRTSTASKVAEMDKSSAVSAGITGGLTGMAGAGTAVGLAHTFHKGFRTKLKTVGKWRRHHAWNLPGSTQERAEHSCAAAPQLEGLCHQRRPNAKSWRNAWKSASGRGYVEGVSPRKRDPSCLPYCQMHS